RRPLRAVSRPPRAAAPWPGARVPTAGARHAAPAAARARLGSAEPQERDRGARRELAVSTWNVDEDVRRARARDHVRLLAEHRLEHDRVAFDPRASAYEVVPFLVAP